MGSASCLVECLGVLHAMDFAFCDVGGTPWPVWKYFKNDFGAMVRTLRARFGVNLGNACSCFSVRFRICVIASDECWDSFLISLWERSNHNVSNLWRPRDHVVDTLG